MKLGKRSKAPEPGDEPASDAGGGAPTDTMSDGWTAPETVVASSPQPEPAVDSDAVELPGGAPPTPEPAARPVPLTIASAPVPPPKPATADDAPALAGAAAAYDGHAADPLLDPLKAIAAERPELVVGAAFAGGILAAMILRRLGN
ncbi:MAG: hypothetical protein QOJ35_405 [Solirubrobacteraceae bacterium]|jgi:hypothetical protein|nr:hypothetical protein [Solirubrobacteraceae bacterium]